MIPDGTCKFNCSSMHKIVLQYCLFILPWYFYCPSSLVSSYKSWLFWRQKSKLTNGYDLICTECDFITGCRWCRPSIILGLVEGGPTTSSYQLTLFYCKIQIGAHHWWSNIQTIDLWAPFCTWWSSISWLTRSMVLITKDGPTMCRSHAVNHCWW